MQGHAAAAHEMLFTCLRFAAGHIHLSKLIAICCNSFPPEGGGAANRIYHLAVLLRDAGYRVQVLCAMPNYPTGRIFPAYKGRFAVDEAVDGISVRRVWMSPSNSDSAFLRGWSAASFVYTLKIAGFPFLEKQQAALVIISSPPLPMAVAAVRYFRKKGRPVLLNISDIWPLSAKALGAVRSQSRLYRVLHAATQKMYLAANAIMAQSQETLHHIQQELSGHQKPMMLYRNLPAGTFYSGARHYPERRVIIYPGLLGHAQGLLALCRAIDFTACGAELHIYGKGGELREIRSFIAQHPGRGITLFEPVSEAQLQTLLPHAIAVLVPLAAPIEGALPSKLFTAAQAGIPVLYSGGGEGAELVDQLGLGWVAAPGDYEHIARQIQALVSLSPDAWQEKCRHIATVAVRHFNKQEQDRIFLSFLESLL